MKKAAGAYKKIMDFSKADVTKLTDSDKQSNTFLDTNSEIIDAYIKNFGNAKEENQDIDGLLKAYYLRYPNKKPMPPLERQNGIMPDTGAADKAATEQAEAEQNKKKEAEEKEKKASQEDRDRLDAQLGTVLADTELNIENKDQKEDHDKLSGGINPSAMKGLKDISAWMLRNGAKTGAYSGNERIRFVTKGVLNEDARVKLFAYYLVEKGMEKEANPDSLKVALAESQTNYIPDLAAFKDKVIASKFKFWKRFDASHFYWEKISAAIRLAIKNRDFLKPFGSLGHEVNASDQGGEDAGEQAQDASKDKSKGNASSATPQPASGGSGDSGSAGNTPVQSQPAKSKAAADSNAAALKKAAQERETRLSDYVAAGKMLMEMRQKLSKNPHQDEMNQKALINAQIARVNMLFEDLKDSDKNVENIYETLAGGDLQDTPEKEEEKDTSEQLGEASEAITDAMDLPGQPSELMEHYNNLAKAANGMNPSWHIAEIPDEAVEYMKNLGATEDVLSIAGSALSCFNLVLKMVKIYQDSSTMTAGTLAMEGMDAFSSAFEIASSLTETIQGLLGVAEAAVETTSGAMGAVAGAINIVSGLVTLNAMADQQDSLDTAKSKLKRDSKAQKMVRLGERTTSIRADHAAAQMVSGSLELMGGVLTATGVSAVAGAALGTVGAIISLTSDVVKYFQNRQNMKDTIDDYVNMDKMMDIINKSVKDKSSMNTDEVKDQLREEMVARLHYASIEDLYDSIVDEYAAYIYNHIFFENGNLSKPLDKEAKANEGYIDLLKGFGAEPDFSKKKPGPKAIAEYLKKV
jgi:hypothetical protein